MPSADIPGALKQMHTHTHTSHITLSQIAASMTTADTPEAVEGMAKMSEEFKKMGKEVYLAPEAASN